MTVARQRTPEVRPVGLRRQGQREPLVVVGDSVEGEGRRDEDPQREQVAGPDSARSLGERSGETPESLGGIPCLGWTVGRLGRHAIHPILPGPARPFLEETIATPREETDTHPGGRWRSEPAAPSSARRASVVSRSLDGKRGLLGRVKSSERAFRRAEHSYPYRSVGTRPRPRFTDRARPCRPGPGRSVHCWRDPGATPTPAR
jgi:hypothetical protein